MTITRNLTGVANPTFAVFHVHPNNSGPYPSTPDNNKLGNKKGDTGVADDYGIPFLVISSRGLAMYDPKMKDDPKTKGMTMLRQFRLAFLRFVRLDHIAFGCFPIGELECPR